MLYKIKYMRGNSTERVTALRFKSWEDAAFYLEKVMRYKWLKAAFTKRDLTAHIICQNGIPF